MKRKHRVIVEVTFDEPRTQKAAREYIHGALEGIYHLPTVKQAGVTKYATKEGQRVLIGELRNLRERAASVIKKYDGMRADALADHIRKIPLEVL